MAWFSILPAHLNTLETWIVRFFVSLPSSYLIQANTVALQLLLGIMTIGPWAVLVVYDIALYIIRAIAYEVPFFGGRARGRGRPRAPSLKERPNGRKRTFSISTGSGSASDEHGILRNRILETLDSSGDETGDITEEG